MEPVKTTRPMNSQESMRVLDGGIATQLERKGHVLDDDLWSARLLLENPNDILDIHKQFLLAGANIVTSSSYQATIEGFKKFGTTDQQAKNLISDSVNLARRACRELSESTSEKLVAAGVGPFGAARADGSEYTGSYESDTNQLYHFHRQRWDILRAAEPDLMLCETIPNILEVEALIRLTESCDIPVWISCSCRDETAISDGTPIQQIANLIANSSVYGMGLNCLPPSLVAPLVKRIRFDFPDLPVMVYPNSGETYQVSTRSWMGDSEISQFIELAKQWVKLGVNVIGGCCRTTPDHIRALKSLQIKK